MSATPSVESLSLEEKVGQLFHVGFDGTEPTAAVEELIREYHVGGVIYFSRNIASPEQTRTLSQSIQRMAADSGSGLPLFVSVDQEGGTVRRLPFHTPVPGQMAIGATDDPNAAATVGGVTARQLRSVGINWNLAPVLDVNNNPDNPVVGVRSYGEEAERVGEFGARYVDALQSVGVLACGKHFPGHGDTTTDSHADMPVVDADEERVRRVELTPFERAIDAGIDAIMTAHVAFPALTGSDTTPATISRDVLTGCLRDQLGFEGLIVTDCMEMNAISDSVGTPGGAVEAVRAGADAVLVSHTPETQRAAIDAVVEAAEDGDLPDSRIDDAVERILSLKRSRTLSSLEVDEPTDSDALEPDTSANRDAIREIATDAVTLVTDDAGLLPLATDEPLSVVAASSSVGSPAEDNRPYTDALFEALETQGYATELTQFTDASSLDPSSIVHERVLCCTAGAARDPEQAAAVESLVDAGLEPVVVAVRDPYDYHALPFVETFLTTYDPTLPNFEALAAVLAGDRTPRGRVLPSLR
ncbi:beta-N-acetylhexosaminidase [Natrarchaeobius sp. A-rgal3]|uniref:beta-N-acetylhexosaminidase n=1 Tax=Natrarchaeobius versutus TaxID=1679078 RepID=UPI00350FD1BF